jgi:hypothetical protein
MIPAGTEAQIVGANFDPIPANNVVRINGVTLPPPSPASTRFVLYVTIPATGIPGFPPAGEMPVDVTVQTPTGGMSGVGRATVLPPTSQQAPQISSISPDPGLLQQPLTIGGSNLGSSAQEVQVFFSVSLASPPITAVPTSVQPNVLTVNVPEIPQVRSSSFPVTIQVQVRVGELTSAAFPHAFSK